MAYNKDFPLFGDDYEKLAQANYLITVKRLSKAKTAKQIGVSVRTISRWVKADFALFNKDTINSENKTIAKFLLDRGYSNNEVATILMVSNTTIANWIDDYKWKETEVKNIDVGGDIAILCWSFLQYIRDHDPETFLKVLQLIKTYRTQRLSK